jgi:3-hydroxyacyl-CoA dehydrogenase/enoyl-CoA hydratase/3-hydroxybutyryl-CoA epimerase
MNVLSVELMDALDALMSRVESDPAVRAVVLTSGKSTFLAGADLVMVRGYTDQAKVLGREALFELCGRLGRQFVRLEASTKPWVAAVNGIALGGGLELAMSCRARIVVDDRRIQLGLPEVRWGLLPGAGGTQRLPRLAGFEAGLELLLSGRSMEPEEAVARRVFDAAVPAGELLERAHALALKLCDQAFDPAAKFRHLDQTEVPAHSPETAREMARAHGVSDADFADYPAYGVIVDCVLLGARQPLAQATATEMWQFLRLMVDPVAGLMVRTLFLNRQRADRALAPPSDLRIAAICHGAWTPALQPWADALGRLKLPVAVDPALPAGVAVLTDTLGGEHRVFFSCLGDDTGSADPTVGARALLTPSGPYGRVMEIHARTSETVTDVQANAAALALAALASRLGALPYRSAGDGARSLLNTLKAASLEGVGQTEAQAAAALDLWAAGAVPQPEWADVAACVSGVAPAFAGGPFAHLWGHHERLLPRWDVERRQAWARLQPRLQEAYA